jgi:hypothetical protein
MSSLSKTLGNKDKTLLLLAHVTPTPGLARKQRRESR